VIELQFICTSLHCAKLNLSFLNLFVYVHVVLVHSEWLLSQLAAVVQFMVMVMLGICCCAVHDGLLYTTSHEWLKDHGDGVLSVGITDHAQVT